MEWSVAIGVDTHKRTHAAVACDRVGRQLDSLQIPACLAGYRRLLAWAEALGQPAFSVEGSGSYGAGLARFLVAAAVPVVECERPHRRDCRRGKSDLIDAALAARKLVAGDGLSGLRGDGVREDLRLLLLERRSAATARAAAPPSARPRSRAREHRQRDQRARADARARAPRRMRRRRSLRRPARRLQRRSDQDAQRGRLRCPRRHQPRRRLKRKAAAPPPQPRRRPPTQPRPTRDRARPRPPPPADRRLLPATTRHRQNTTRSTPLRQARPRTPLLPQAARNHNQPLMP
jgi:hypothetical protein